MHPGQFFPQASCVKWCCFVCSRPRLKPCTLLRGNASLVPCFYSMQANKVGADESLMLDPNGFVATCNSVNFFIVRRVSHELKHVFVYLSAEKCMCLCVMHGWVVPIASVQGELWAPSARYQLHGITREQSMQLARDMGIPVFEKDFSLTEVIFDNELALLTSIRNMTAFELLSQTFVSLALVRQTLFPSPLSATLSLVHIIALWFLMVPFQQPW